MPYLVHSADDRAEMLAALGSDSLERLLVDIPARLRLRRLDIDDGLSEQETMDHVRGLAAHLYRQLCLPHVPWRLPAG